MSRSNVHVLSTSLRNELVKKYCISSARICALDVKKKTAPNMLTGSLMEALPRLDFFVIPF